MTRTQQGRGDRFGRGGQGPQGVLLAGESLPAGEFPMGKVGPVAPATGEVAVQTNGVPQTGGDCGPTWLLGPPAEVVRELEQERARLRRIPGQGTLDYCDNAISYLRSRFGLAS